MLTCFPCLPCYRRQQCHTRLDHTASDRWLTRRETEGCFLLCEIYSASCQLKENDETQRDERSSFYLKK
jgi:hypothetical protein